MKDITHKTDTRRTARAAAFLAIDNEILQATDFARNTDKGDAIEASRLAAIMAVKRTWEALPFCHQIPITHCDAAFELRDDGIYIEVTATTIAPTGVEMETLYGASVAAMNLYDMLKPHAAGDTGHIRVTEIYLVNKRGGKSDYPAPRGVKAAILVTDDATFAGQREDKAGQALRQALEQKQVEIIDYRICGNSQEAINKALDDLLALEPALLITVGGTGLKPGAHTPDVVRSRLDQEAPGIMEAARAHGQRRTPLAMLSRGVAGLIGPTLVATFPGSEKGAIETADALLTGLLHAASGGC